MNASIVDFKPQISRAPASDSNSSRADSTRDASASSTRTIDSMEKRHSGGYIYVSAALVKAPTRMTPTEHVFAKLVQSRLQNEDAAPSFEDDAEQCVSHEETLRAQLAQWRAEDEARATIQASKQLRFA